MVSFYVAGALGPNVVPRKTAFVIGDAQTEDRVTHKSTSNANSAALEYGHEVGVDPYD